MAMYQMGIIWDLYNQSGFVAPYSANAYLGFTGAVGESSWAVE